MLAIHLKLQWYSLIDTAMEEAKIEVPTMRRFADIELIRDGIHDKSTILNFRDLPEKQKPCKQVFETVKSPLSARGMTIQLNTIIDAGLIGDASSTNNKEGKRDPEMHQAKKGNQWYFGMKVHTVADEDLNLNHSVVVTAANVLDLSPATELLHGEESVVCCDSGYLGIEKTPEMASKVMEFRVVMPTEKRRALPHTAEGGLQETLETAKIHIPSEVEHPFRVIKQQFGFQKTRLRGLAKKRCQINVLSARTNLFMVRRQLLAAT